MNERTIYALGFFDGVHLGHQALLTACCHLAAKRGCVPAAVTFDLPPGAVLQNLQPNMLCTVQDRVQLLRQFGIGPIYIYGATKENLSVTWQTFLEELLEYGADGFVCGYDYRFGYGGEGTAKKLALFAAERNLPCIIVPEQTVDGIRVSSTHIRQLLAQGDVENANRFLGHPHILTGIVQKGKQLGRTISIPTANLDYPADLLQLKKGVYACTAQVDGKEYLAVTNIGTRPTVDGQDINIEAHLLDFEGDLYGKSLTLAFYRFLRPEKKFDSLAQLQAEIQENARQTRKFFEKSE